MMKETAFCSLGKISVHRVGKYTLKVVRKTRKATVLKVTKNVNAECDLTFSENYIHNYIERHIIVKLQCVRG